MTTQECQVLIAARFPNEPSRWVLNINNAGPRIGNPARSWRVNFLGFRKNIPSMRRLSPAIQIQLLASQ